MWGSMSECRLARSWDGTGSDAVEAPAIVEDRHLAGWALSTRGADYGAEALTGICASLRWRRRRRRYVASFSPQNLTAAVPTLWTRSVGSPDQPKTKPEPLRSALSSRSRGPGTSSVTKEPIWLTTFRLPVPVARGVTRKPTK